MDRPSFFRWLLASLFAFGPLGRAAEVIAQDDFSSERPGWVVEQIDLAALSAVGHDFTLTLLASDCPYSGHAGYVYLDGFGAVNPPTGQVPEPGSLALLGLGFAGLAAARQRQKKAA